MPRSRAPRSPGPASSTCAWPTATWRDELRAILAEGADYGRSAIGAGRPVNVEYVSANPTGPMHMGHCRGAVVGDALASLLEFAGHEVMREYYVNDAGGAGADARPLGPPALPRGARRSDIGEIPGGLYPGDYLVPIGQALAAEFGDRYADAPEERMARACSASARSRR